MLNIGTRIVITSLAQSVHPAPTGTIAGFANYQSQHTGHIEPGYIVRLDKGLWTEDRFAFIDLIVVRPCNAVEEGEHE